MAYIGIESAPSLIHRSSLIPQPYCGDMEVCKACGKNRVSIGRTHCDTCTSNFDPESLLRLEKTTGARVRYEKRAESFHKGLIGLRKISGWATLGFFSLFIISVAALDPNKSIDHTFGRLPNQGIYDSIELGWWLSMMIYILSRGVHRVLFR